MPNINSSCFSGQAFDAGNADVTNRRLVQKAVNWSKEVFRTKLFESLISVAAR
jgi:hypothetical protein